MCGHLYFDDDSSRFRSHSDRLRSRINAANRARSLHIWSLTDDGYEPIDWQRDFKSGFRWSESIWYTQIEGGIEPGTDIKVPWELGRMQHLPQLAWAYGLAKSGESEQNLADRHLREFRNQILDFVAANPPQFGVNWRCTMDVAIRIANWLVAYDLFRAFGAKFNPEFDAVFINSIRDHGRHIVANLEWDERIRANHYLADLAGLLFVSAFLSQDRQTACWLEFAVREYLNEVSLQFTEDGANFEASTAYHRLSAEMVAYSTALIQALPAEKVESLHTTERCTRFHSGPHVVPPGWSEFVSRCRTRLPEITVFPEWYIKRLRGMADFTCAVSSNTERIVQIGDNDSGRFLKLWPSMRPTIAAAENDDDSKLLTEDYLDHRHLVAAISGLLGTGLAGNVYEPFRGEYEAIQAIGGKPALFKTAESALRQSDAPISTTFDFPGFGLYLITQGPLRALFRCGPVGQHGNGGHAHNDQLSFELWYKNDPLFVDPGTYVYTPDWEERNRFRSTAMHNTLAIPGVEQNTWSEGRNGLFQLFDQAHARIISRNSACITGEHDGFGSRHRRTIQISDFKLTGTDDICKPGAKWIYFHLDPAVIIENQSNSRVTLRVADARVTITTNPGQFGIVESAFSAGYGEIVQSRACRIESTANEIRWAVEILATD